MKRIKAGKKTEAIRKNPYKLATIVLFIVVVFLLASPHIQNKLNEKTNIQNFVDDLIENKVIFVYSSGCSACHVQIEIFGSDWNRYVDSGLTLDCADQSSEICMNIRATPSWVINNGTDYIIVGEGVKGNE